MPAPRPLPDPFDARPFTTSEAQNAGVSRDRMRRLDLERPFHGVRVPRAATALGRDATVDAAPTPDDVKNGSRTSRSPREPGMSSGMRHASRGDDLRARVVAYLAKMPEHHLFSHLTAAELLGLRMPERRLGTELHVLAVGGRAPEGRGIVGHGTAGRRDQHRLGRGIRTTAPLDTWCDLATMLNLDELIAMGDGLVRRERPLARMAELETAVAARTGMPGSRRLREALTWVRPRTDSARETALRLLLLRAGLPEPEINGVIRNCYGAVIAHGDLVYRPQRTIVEYDGAHHRTDARQYRIDVARLDALMEEGWRIIRVDTQLLATRATLITKVTNALTRHGAHGTDHELRRMG